MTGHLLLVDASGFAFRSFHAYPARYRESDGQPTGAVLGFMSMLWRMLGAAQADKPTHAAAVFDMPGKNFRHRLFPSYKANRPPARNSELADQMPLMRHAAEALGLTPIDKKGYEADDVIATLAHRAKQAGMRTTIVSSDKDFGQLVEDGHVEIIDPVLRKRLLQADIEKKWGVAPNLVPVVQALSGDAVDGIPGLPGIGLDKAQRLVRRYGDLKAILKNADECRWPHVRAELKRKADLAELYLRLTTLRRDVALKVNFDELVAQVPLRSHLLQICRILEATPRFQAVFGLDPVLCRPAEQTVNEFEWWTEELIAPGQKIPDDPQSGFFKRKLIRGGPFVPARIWREPELDDSAKPTGRDIIRCELNGWPKDPMSEWSKLSMKPITREEFNFMCADKTHAEAYRPNDPKANPTKPIQLELQPASRNPRRKVA